MFSFQNPAGFLLLLLIPLFYFFRKFKILNQTVIYAVLGDWEGKHFEWHGKIRKFFSVLSKIMIIAGFILTVIAFADPVVSSQEKVYTTLGTDIIFVVDTSPSMAAKDIDGTRRIDAAKNAIINLTQSHDGYRYGLVLLGSNAYVSVPPTTDNSIFAKKLDEIQVGILGNGSAIGDGLSTAICHLASSSAPKKCIILLTDGENNAGEIHPETAAKLASENSITLYVIGIGTRGTVPIEYTDLKTGKLYSGYLESDYNAASLKKIAGIGAGRYFEVRSVDELRTGLSTVAKAEVVTQNFTYKTITTTFYRQFLFVAIIILAIACFFKYLILHEYISYHLKRIILLRNISLFTAYAMLILAWSGLSWGTYLSPVQKSDTAVSFVFDISNSMTARDIPGDRSRLEAAGIFAKKLMSKMGNTNISVVLTKGDGIAAIPLTEDYSMITSLIEVMSPALMTAPGSSLGKGILTARNTFPANYSAAGRIWVFTDGEETDGALVSALTECIKTGIPVTIIGFGNEIESEILAGDGKTRIYTALRSEAIENSLSQAKEKLNFYKNQTPLTYINFTEVGSASKLLSQIIDKKDNKQVISYEAKPVPRYKLFLTLAFLFFVLSFFFGEFEMKKITRAKDKKNAVTIISLIMLFSGCSSESSKIFMGTYHWHKKNYQHAVSLYLDAYKNAPEDKKIYKDYSLYDLGVAYGMLGEDEAALDRYASISEDASDELKFNAYYNAGIIAHQNTQFETAQNYFRKALEIDNSRIDAKINMELSIQMMDSESRQNESEAIPASEEKPENPELENEVFKHIKENDKKQWKNSESNQSQNLANDY